MYDKKAEEKLSRGTKVTKGWREKEEEGWRLGKYDQVHYILVQKYFIETSTMYNGYRAIKSYLKTFMYRNIKKNPSYCEPNSVFAWAYANMFKTANIESFCLTSASALTVAENKVEIINVWVVQFSRREIKKLRWLYTLTFFFKLGWNLWRARTLIVVDASRQGNII